MTDDRVRNLVSESDRELLEQISIRAIRLVREPATNAKWHELQGAQSTAEFCGLCQFLEDSFGKQIMDLSDPTCQHGISMNVHCCNCHNGLIFDQSHTCTEA